MPLYDYRCEKKHNTEIYWTFETVPPLETPAECPKCKAPAYRQYSRGTSIINNKVMNPPSRRMKPGHLGSTPKGEFS